MKKLGEIKVKSTLTVPGTMHNFNRAVEIKVIPHALEIRQFPFVCVFCGIPALSTLNDKGVCKSCLTDLKQRFGKELTPRERLHEKSTKKKGETRKQKRK